MAEKTELARLWNDAVSEYSRKMNRKFDAEKLRAPVSNSDDLEALIENHSSKFAKFRANHGKLASVVLSAMKRLKSLSKVAQAGVGLTPFAPASVIIEAACFLIDASSAVADTYDSLEILFRRIQDITDRLGEYVKGAIDKKLRNIIVNLLCSLLDVFCEAEEAIRRGRGREMLRRVAGKEDKVQNALDRLDQMWQTELGLIIAKTYATTQRIDEKFDVNRNQELLDQALSANVARDMERLYTEIEESRLPQSGEWLLKQQLFRRWVQMEFPVLWVLGKPGTGKTYLASRVITYLRESQLYSHRGVVGYFYIRESMQTQYTPSIVLTSIASQIAKSYGAYRERAAAACKDGSSLLSPNLIWNAFFVEYFSKDTSRPIFMVIDGVDESQHEHQRLLLTMAKQLSDLRARSNYPLVQILLLGRPELEYNLSNVWAGKARPKVIYVQPSKSRADIRRFIRKGVNEDISLLHVMHRRKSTRRQAKILRDEITLKLGQTADGMFMLAKLMLVEIKDMNKPELIRDALDRPPEGLRDMFKRVITKLAATKAFDKRDLNEILMWIACAKRDLLLGEVDLVVKLRDLQQDGLYALEDDLRTRFGSFFTVSSTDIDSGEKDDSESVPVEYSKNLSTAPITANTAQDNEENKETDFENWTDMDNDSDRDSDSDSEADIPPNFLVATVKFSHASVGQHFRTQGFHEGVGMDFKTARAHVAETCLLFLTDHIQKKDGRPWSPSLLQYSADHFLDHLIEVDIEALRDSQPEQFSKISNEIFYLFRNLGTLRRWYIVASDRQRLISQLFDVCSRIREWIPDHTTSDRFNRSEARWLQRAKATSQDLLRPFAQMVAMSWLAFDDTAHDTLEDVIFLDRYMSMNNLSQPHWGLALKRPLQQIAERISPERIRQLASWGQLKRTLGWHIRIGVALYEIKTPKHLREFVQECRRARRKHGESWNVYYNEAIGLHALQRYREVITTVSHAFRQKLPIETSEQLYLTELVRESHLELGNFKAAIEAASKACRLDPLSDDAAFKMIQTFHRARQFSNSFDYIKSILKTEDDFSGAGLLGKIISSNLTASESITIACAESGQLDFARDLFMVIAAKADVSGNALQAAWANYALAHLYSRRYGDDDKAITIWVGITENHLGSTVGHLAASTLATLYYTKATEANEDEKLWISKLKVLSEQMRRSLHENTSPSLWKTMSQYEVLALLGRWYKEQGDSEQARLVIRPLVKSAMIDLTDRDYGNDCDAYINLAKALIGFGDRENGEIAWAFTAPLQKSNELQKIEGICRSSGKSLILEGLGENTHQGEGMVALISPEGLPKRKINSGEDVPFDLLGVCDGMCSRREAHFKSFSICEICNDIGFCDECLQSLKTGTLPFRICNSNHPFIEIYPPKGLVTKVEGEYKVRSKGESISADEWLNMISRQWLSE